MEREQFAALLNGRAYNDEITREEEKVARDNNLIVIFGASDDLVEFRGALYDEIGAYDGADFLIANPNTKIATGEEYCGRPTYFWAEELMPVVIDLDEYTENPIGLISALWCPEDKEHDYSWYIQTDIPHSVFDIKRDGEMFCRGIVISTNDIPNYPN